MLVVLFPEHSGQKSHTLWVLHMPVSLSGCARGPKSVNPVYWQTATSGSIPTNREVGAKLSIVSPKVSIPSHG